MASLDGNFTKHGHDCENLKDAFTTFLPKGFNCRIHYTHSPSKPCEPLFSPCAGTKPEKTRLASHFLTVSIPLTEQSQSQSQTQSPNGPPSNQHVLVFAMEVLVYSSQGLVTMFVSKADSTGHLPPRRPSPIKSVATTFLWWLATQQRKLTRSMGTTLVVSLFARAQSQYLFPGSADHGNKHVLDDRQLIRWWARVLDPLFLTTDHSDSDNDKSQGLDLQGYMTVPGYHAIETKSFFPPSPSLNPHSSEKSKNWTPGNPLAELASARGVPATAPPRCLLPRFPDDPKARFMQDLDDEVGLAEDAVAASPTKQKTSGRWKSITDLERFWEAMEFRQECSSGRAVGFLWLVARPPPSERERLSTQEDRESSPSRDLRSNPDSQSSISSQNSHKSTRASPKKQRRTRPLTGPVLARKPRLKGSSPSNVSSATSNPNSTSSPSHNLNSSPNGLVLTAKSYASALQTLLNLDFSSLPAAALSTAKWAAAVGRMGIAGSLSHGAGRECEWGFESVGTAEGAGGVGSGSGSGRAAGGPAPAAVAMANDVGGLVRKKEKKRKVEADDEMGGASDHGAGAAPAPVGGESGGGGINVLVGRKKAKS